MATPQAQPADIQVRIEPRGSTDALLRLSHAAFQAEEEPARYAEVWRHRLAHLAGRPIRRQRTRRGRCDHGRGARRGRAHPAHHLHRSGVVPMGGVSAVCVDERRRKGVGAALMREGG
ncbi:MAG: hypothetical protein R2854_19340 [Caldilineaceae bacterium]